MSLPFYQKFHEHYDRSYRNKDLRTTMSQYHEQEKKSSAIYTHGSTAYSSRSLAAHRQEAQAFSQASAASYQQQASWATESSLASAVSRKAASAYDYGYSHGYVKSSLPTLGRRLFLSTPPISSFLSFLNLASLHLNQAWSKPVCLGDLGILPISLHPISGFHKVLPSHTEESCKQRLFATSCIHSSRTRKYHFNTHNRFPGFQNACL